MLLLLDKIPLVLYLDVQLVFWVHIRERKWSIDVSLITDVDIILKEVKSIPGIFLHHPLFILSLPLLFCHPVPLPPRPIPRAPRTHLKIVIQLSLFSGYFLVWTQNLTGKHWLIFLMKASLTWLPRPPITATTSVIVIQISITQKSGSISGEIKIWHITCITHQQMTSFWFNSFMRHASAFKVCWSSSMYKCAALETHKTKISEHICITKSPDSPAAGSGD